MGVEMVPDGKRTFKVGDKVQTRDGRPARIICDDRDGDLSLVVLIEGRDVQLYRPSGEIDVGNSWASDLVPLPLKLHVWVSWWPTGYRGPNPGTHLTAAGARAAREGGALACIRVEIEEGKFE